MGLFHRDSKTGAETPIEVENVVAEGVALSPVASKAEADAALARLQADVADRDRRIAAYEAEKAEGVKARAAEKGASIRAGGKAFADGLVKANKLMPAGAKALGDLHAFAHLHAAGLPADGLDPVASFAGLEAGLVPHNLTAEAVADASTPAGGTVVLSNGGKDDKPSDARVRELLANHPSGQAALAMLDRKSK